MASVDTTIHGAPTTDRLLIRRTELALRIAAEEIHDFAGTLVPTGGEIAAARTLAVLHRRYKTLAVLSARIVRAATWTQVAAQLHVEPATAEALYGDAEERWRTGDPQPWAPSGRAFAAGQVDAAPIVIDTEADADAAAEALAAHRPTGTCGCAPAPR